MIDKKKIALDAIDKAIKGIDKHFTDTTDPAISSIPSDHIRRLQRKLIEMKKSIEENRIEQAKTLVGLGRVIADSWPYDSVIGGLIIDAEQSFKKYIA